MNNSLAAFALLFVSAAASQAQSKPTPIQPVTVVATRTPEAPHDIPASIEVISGSDLRARGATSLRDALSLAAGVSIAPGGDNGPASATPEIWGLREFDAFLLVVDGVPAGGAFNPAVASLSLRDVERIEVLRGPAPVTFGATSFVGVIHVVHKSAAEPSRILGLTGGSFQAGGGSIDYGFKEMNGWASRLSADFDHQGFKDDHTQFTRGHGSWRASKTAGQVKHWVSLDLNILQQDPASPHLREGPVLSTTTPLDQNYNPAGAYLNENRFAAAAGFERPVLDGVTWASTASYTRTSNKIFRGFLTDPSNTPNNASGTRENIDVNDLYVDSHIIWPVKSNARWMAGADLLYGSGDAKGATFTYTAPIWGPLQGYKAEPSNLNLDAEDTRMFFGAYGSAEWKPDPRFTVNAGLRLNVTSEERGSGADQKQDNTKLSYSLGAIYSLWESGADHLRAFVNYRDTFKPAAVDWGLGDEDEVLKPETSTSYEGGFKVRGMEGQVNFEASYFHMDFTNLVSSTVINGQPAFENAGKTRFQGFELAADYKLTDATWLRGSYSSHDGKFVDFVQDFGGTLTQLAGKRFEMSAKQLYSAGLTYSPESGFTANVNYNYVGDRFLNKRNTAPAAAFSTYDAGVGYRMGRWEVRIDGKNLGNARDAVSESEIGDAQYYRMPATTVRAGIAVRF